MANRNSFESSPGSGSDGNAASIRDALIAEASGILRSNLRSPDQGLPFHWVGTSISGREVFDINSALPLALAWRSLDVSKAESLLKCIFYLQNSDGGIASRYLSDGTPLTSDAPWPLLIQATRKVWKTGKNTDFLKAIMPRIYRYADWICYHFDPDQTGIPRWQSKEEALIPDIYREDAASADLTILLLSELESIIFFENETPDIFTDNLYIKPEIDKFAKLLENHFWDHSSARCVSKKEKGEVIEAPLFYTGLLSMTKSISPELRVHSRPVLAAALADIHNHSLWSTTGSEQINTIFPILLINSALSAGMLAECLQFCDQVKNRIGDFIRSTGKMPDSLKKDMDKQVGLSTSPSFGAPVTMAALLVYIDNFIGMHGSEPTAGMALMHKLNRHPLTSVLAPVTAMALLIFAIALYNIRRTEPTGSRLDASMGLANHYYETGRYEQALRISDTLIDDDLEMQYPRLMRAKILYRMGRYSDAESEYQKLLDADLLYPAVRVNLALLKYKLDKPQEALEIYSNFIENYESDFPHEAAKAKNAIELITGNPWNPDEETHADDEYNTRF